MVTVWRGMIPYSTNSDNDRALIERDPLAFVKQVVRFDHLGVHWTTSLDYARRRAQRNWGAGVVLRAEVPESSIIPVGSAEYDAFSHEHQLMSPDSVEKEISIRQGAPLDLTGWEVIVDEELHDRGYVVAATGDLSMQVHAGWKFAKVASRVTVYRGIWIGSEEDSPFPEELRRIKLDHVGGHWSLIRDAAVRAIRQKAMLSEPRGIIFVGEVDADAAIPVPPGAQWLDTPHGRVFPTSDAYEREMYLPPGTPVAVKEAQLVTADWDGHDAVHETFPFSIVVSASSIPMLKGLARKAQETGTLDTFKTIHNVALGYQETGSINDDLDLDTVTDRQVQQATKQIYDASQRGLVADGFPDVITVYRKTRDGSGRGPESGVVSVSTTKRDTFTNPTKFQVRRSDVLTYGEGLQRGTYKEDELHVDAKNLTRVATAKVASTHTLYYGTTKNAWSALRSGQRKMTPREISSMVEGAFKLPSGSVWNHPTNAWAPSRDEQGTSGYIYTTTDRQIAEGYAQAGGAPLYDALKAAYQLLYPERKQQDIFSPRYEGVEEWLKEQVERFGGGPLLVTWSVPWGVLKTSFEWLSQSKMRSHPMDEQEFTEWLGGRGLVNDREVSFASADELLLCASRTEELPIGEGRIITRNGALVTKEYEGEVGNKDHITCRQDGTLPTASIAHLQGVMGEQPGEHRNKQGQRWDDFLADVKANGIKEPIFITVDYGEQPKISEGNHRRDAAVELGLPEVPVEIRYFGHAEQQSKLGAVDHAGKPLDCPVCAPLIEAAKAADAEWTRQQLGGRGTEAYRAANRARYDASAAVLDARREHNERVPEWWKLAKTSALYTDARTIGAALRKAGFPAMKTSGSRIRGAPYVTPGYVVEKYIPLNEKRTVIKVYWQTNWALDRSKQPDEREQNRAMGEALEAMGYVVEYPNGGRGAGSSMYVTAPVKTATKTWKRAPLGYYSSDREVLLERGGTMTHGANAWLIWVRDPDQDSTENYNERNTTQRQRFSYIMGMPAEPDAWYYETGVEGGWLSEAKAITEAEHFIQRHLSKISSQGAGLPPGWSFSVGYGDAVPGGYNGTIKAYDPEGNVRGYIDYQTAYGDTEGTVAMVEVEEPYRRLGIADALYEQLKRENPGMTWDPGYTTDEGGVWWRSRSRASLRQASGTWYHGSPHRLNPGDEIAPADELGHANYRANPTSVVYVTPSLEEAWEWAEDAVDMDGTIPLDAPIWVYEVLPFGAPIAVPDPEGHEFSTTRARVVRRIEESVEHRRERLSRIASMSRTADAGRGPGRTHERMTQEIAENTIQHLMRDGGYTVNAHRSVPKQGWMVSLPGHEQQYASVPDVTPTGVQRYIDQHEKVLKQNDHYIGGWVDKTSGKTYLDTSKRINDRDAAIAEGRRNKQLAIYNIGSGEEVRLDMTHHAEALTGTRFYIAPDAGAHEIHRFIRQMAPADIAQQNAAIYSTGNPPAGSDLVREFAVTPVGDDFFAGEADDISRAYRDLPILTPTAAPLWQELGELVEAQAESLKRIFTVIRYDDIDPYENAEQMHDDIDQGIYRVTSLHSHHPVWSVDTNVAFRVSHDLLGHGVAGSDFSFAGEVAAYQAECTATPEHLWPVLFSEIIAQSAYANIHHLFGAQKCGLIPLTQQQIDAAVGKVMDAPDPIYDADPAHRSAIKLAALPSVVNVRPLDDGMFQVLLDSGYMQKLTREQVEEMSKNPEKAKELLEKADRLRPTAGGIMPGWRNAKVARLRV
jgi:ribosomal protein S18 acetylase RimI-like enzyme